MKSPRSLLTGAALLFPLAGVPGSAQISYVDLHPDGAEWSYAADVSGNQQVGTVSAPADRPYDHAARWEGSAASYRRLDTRPPGGRSEGLATQDGLHGGWIGPGDFAYLWDEVNGVEINLHPADARSSYLGGMGGGQQVGFGNVPGSSLGALLWHGTAASAVNLSPAGWPFSRADDTDGRQQVGSVSGGGRGLHAALWEGSAASFVDLHPAAYMSSKAFCVDGGWQGGVVNDGLGLRAVLWNGTPESVVVLHPAGAEHSEIQEMDGEWQVGMTESEEMRFAALWNGSAASYRNLHEVLADDGYTESQALGIEVVDREARIVGWGRAADGERHALMWVVALPDTTPPVIEDLEVGPPVLWPPNRKLRPIDLRITASDDSGVFFWSVTDVTCNEACDERDIRITDHDDGQDLALRASRSGRNKEGRIYTLEVVAWDEAGNLSDPVYRTVTVPHKAPRGSRASRK